MSRQAIVTKYFGPTNTKGSRIKATTDAGSITIPYDYSMSSDQVHAKAAKALAERLGWGGHWIEGGSPGGRGNVYVSAEFDPCDERNGTDGLDIDPADYVRAAFVTYWREG